MDAINGITIERYAELRAKMDDVIKDREKCVRIAESEGIKRADWEAAHEGWQVKFADPSDMGRTASKFMPLWEAAIDKNFISSKRAK
jgi:hypothetical protein